jgi:hypothetical protein
MASDQTGASVSASYPWPYPQEIRDWNARLQDGGEIAPEPHNAHQLAVSFALVRRLNGFGADATDRLGADAMVVVERALDGERSPLERLKQP